MPSNLAILITTNYYWPEGGAKAAAKGDGASPFQASKG